MACSCHMSMAISCTRAAAAGITLHAYSAFGHSDCATWLCIVHANPFRHDHHADMLHQGTARHELGGLRASQASAAASSPALPRHAI